jgi:hypothetical protein
MGVGNIKKYPVCPVLVKAPGVRFLRRQTAYTVHQ